MQHVRFSYSNKDIPIPTRSNYMKKMLEKTENFVQRMRWKAFFFLNPDSKPSQKETYGFKTSKATPFIPEMKSFEDGLYSMIAKIKTKPTESEFQTFIFLTHLFQDTQGCQRGISVFLCQDMSKSQTQGKMLIYATSWSIIAVMRRVGQNRQEKSREGSFPSPLMTVETDYNIRKWKDLVDKNNNN